MKNVKILDCTLRDGGRIINCEFPNEDIKDISYRLAEAKIDIVEVGFLRNPKTVEYKGDSTFFTDVDQICPFVDRTKNTKYVAFIDFELYDFDTLKPFDNTSIDGVRIGWKKSSFANNKSEIIRCLKRVKELGYMLYIQGVNTLGYKDKELLDILEFVNEIHPNGFGIVDTYGAMYMDDVERIYTMVDHNLEEDIAIDFHSHNNYQLSFAFAQEIIRLSNGKREILIDGTLNGMGKVAGNLCTELIIDYLVRKRNYDYNFDAILDIIDDYVYPYMLQHKWGYSVPALMAGIYKSHPNNVIYLTEKFRLATKDIMHILSMIEPTKRMSYDYDNIQNLYREYIADKVNDHTAITFLKQVVENKEVFVYVPGNTINTHREQIEKYVADNKPIRISVNFIADDKEVYAFFGNQKRYDKLAAKRAGRKVIVASNVKSSDEHDVIVNYHSLINRGYKYFENSTIMLLNLMKVLNPSKITIAGFDGFRSDFEQNYADSSYQNNRHIAEFDTINKEVSLMLADIIKTLAPECEVKLLTPSVYSVPVLK